MLHPIVTLFAISPLDETFCHGVTGRLVPPESISRERYAASGARVTRRELRGHARFRRSGLPGAAILRARSGPARRLGCRRDEGRPRRARRPPASPCRAQLRAHESPIHPARRRLSLHRTRAVAWFEYADTTPPA